MFQIYIYGVLSMAVHLSMWKNLFKSHPWHPFSWHFFSHESHSHCWIATSLRLGPGGLHHPGPEAMGPAVTVSVRSGSEACASRAGDMAGDMADIHSAGGSSWDIWETYFYDGSSWFSIFFMGKNHQKIW